MHLRLQSLEHLWQADKEFTVVQKVSLVAEKIRRKVEFRSQKNVLLGY